MDAKPNPPPERALELALRRAQIDPRWFAAAASSFGEQGRLEHLRALLKRAASPTNLVGVRCRKHP
ncbi:MAG: hypothetical protein AAFU79_14335 [Myxococcota bacterium]